MTDRLLFVVALAVLAGFLGILLWHVPRLDLGLLVAVTLALVVTDIVRAHRRG